MRLACVLILLSNLLCIEVRVSLKDTPGRDKGFSLKDAIHHLVILPGKW